MIVCQVVGPEYAEWCDYRESGGMRCEVVGPHRKHYWSEHTIAHERMGNGYSCAAVERALDDNTWKTTTKFVRVGAF